MTINDGWEEYSLTFDNSFVSESDVRRLLAFCPYYLYRSTPNTIPGIDGPVFTASSNRAGVWDKIFLPPRLEEGTNGAPWRDNKLLSPHFLAKARGNLAWGRRQLTQLKHLDHPRDLDPVIEYLTRNFAAGLWMEETRYEFYKTWDMRVLARNYEGFNTALACSDVLQQIKDAGSKEEKYNLARVQWHDCLMPCLRTRFGTYPMGSWKSFLRDYHITERYLEFPAD